MTVEVDGKTYGPHDLIMAELPSNPVTQSTSVGNDEFHGGPGNDTFHGGDGDDTADYSEAASGISISLADGRADNDGDGGSDTMDGIENVTGSRSDDTIVGNGAANTIKGGKGADKISGGVKMTINDDVTIVLQGFTGTPNFTF